MFTQEKPPRHVPWFLRRFVERDEVDTALADLERQGSTTAHIAHLCASLLVLLFSAGSLVALGSDALTAILTDWQRNHTLDIPSTITVCVSTLMVLAMDCGMVYAASMLRVLSTRRATLRESWIHIMVIASVAMLEASTYAYMSYRFEQPSGTAAQALILARALAAPLLAVYLSLARPLPVTSRDIMSQVELASGRGLLHDVTVAANDRTAPLAQKMRLYNAAAVMSSTDRARLDTMIGVVIQDMPHSEVPHVQADADSTAENALRARYDGTGWSHTKDTRLTDPAASTASIEATSEMALDRAQVHSRQPAGHLRDSKRGTLQQKPLLHIARPRQSVESRLRALMIAEPGISVRQLAKRAKVSESTASKYRRLVTAENELNQHPVRVEG